MRKLHPARFKQARCMSKISALKNLSTLLLRSGWGKILAFEALSGSIVFSFAFLRTRFLANSDLKHNSSFDFNSYYDLPASLFLAIISIVLFYTSTFFKHNNGIRDSVGGLSAATGALGFSIILLSSLLDPTVSFFQIQTQNAAISSFFKTVEYLFFSSLYLLSVFTVYMLLYWAESK
ncbi:MAG: hypothetical protein SW833_11325 [Cyanobacteriota bacterium]|nr:hypothetical protein [Cyanobacteriota bacterium]